MRKDKTFQANLLGRNNVAVNPTIESDNTIFYTTDTEAFINIFTIDEGFTFINAELTMVNGTDKSVVVQQMDIDESGTLASYEMEPDVIAHHGRWQVQVVFTETNSGENFTSKLFQFDVYPHLLDGKVERLIDIDGITGNINALAERAKMIIAEVEAIDEQAIADEISANLSHDTQRVIDFIETGFAYLYAPKINLAPYDEGFTITAEPRDTGEAHDNTNFITLSVPLVAGQEYTLSFDYEKIGSYSDPFLVRVNYPDPSPRGSSILIKDAKRAYYTFTSESTKNSRNIYIYAGNAGATRGQGVKISRIKLEEGGLSGYVAPRKP